LLGLLVRLVGLADLCLACLGLDKLMILNL